MDIKEIRENARERMKGFCRVCKVCDGTACAGEVPGMGGVGTGSSFKANVESLSKIKLNLRTIHNATDPDISCEFLGYKLDMPIFAAPVTGMPYNCGGYLSEEEYGKVVATACKSLNTVYMNGDGGNPIFYKAGLNAIKETGVLGIPIVKPRENSEIITRIKWAEEASCIAAGVDVDGAGLVTMSLMGQKVSPKTVEELKEIVNSTKLPFILKGIMTVDEAEKAVEIGAKAIVVSNHGGRILDSTRGVAEVLPDIAKAVKGKITILADGGIRSGIDVLKLLALGADAVLIARPVIIGAIGGGVEGVITVMKKMADELYQAMILTGCRNIKDIDNRIIYRD